MHEGHRERLRQKYMLNGFDGLAEHEALELLLTYSIPRKNTNPIAHALIKSFGSIDAVLNADWQNLALVEGVGNSTAVFLSLIGKLKAQNPYKSKNKPLRLNTPIAAALFGLETMKNEKYECVYAISLNKNMKVLRSAKILTGTLTETPFYPRLVIESALLNKAYALLLMHNHPSGDPSPSKEDIKATVGVEKALKSIDIQFYDHLIVGKDAVYSCARDVYINPVDSSKSVRTNDNNADTNIFNLYKENKRAIAAENGQPIKEKNDDI